MAFILLAESRQNGNRATILSRVARAAISLIQQTSTVPEEPLSRVSGARGVSSLFGQGLPITASTMKGELMRSFHLDEPAQGTVFRTSIRRIPEFAPFLMPSLLGNGKPSGRSPDSTSVMRVAWRDDITGSSQVFGSQIESNIKSVDRSE
jgi:hypothetical protein